MREAGQQHAAATGGDQAATGPAANADAVSHNKSLRHNTSLVAKSQALAAHAKVSEHPIILSLTATYEDEDFLQTLCGLCHGTCVFSTAEVSSSLSEHQNCLLHIIKTLTYIHSNVYNTHIYPYT